MREYQTRDRWSEFDGDYESRDGVLSHQGVVLLVPTNYPIREDTEVVTACNLGHGKLLDHEDRGAN